MTEDPSARLLDIADALYSLAPGEFTSARDEQVKALKGNPLAAQVKALRKPSLAAWVVNTLVRHESDQVDQVLSLGAALREAQATMSGEELRALTRQRRQLTAAVTTRARALSREHGQRVTQGVADQVEATLGAAMVDEGCAAAVRSGLLVGALAATGVEAVDVSAAVALPEALGFLAPAREASPPTKPDLHVVPDPDRQAKELAAARADLEESQSALEAAAEELDDASSGLSELEAKSMQIQAEIDELRRKIADLDASADEVDEAIAEAEERRDQAQEAVALATRDRDTAAARVERLRG
ncbi:hypothetical protein [Nocardioides sp.]|uniref:hypothetical protein n=1 Tax=Nocardioides sp. TaxID=35761 RepID=UPI003566EBCD